MTDKDGNKTTYGYDHLDRLKTARTETSASALVDEYAYTYDAASNRLSQTKTVGAGTPAVTNHKYNQANQQCWRAPSTPTSACSTTPTGGTGLTYDANGNVLTDGRRTFAYNARNQASSVTPVGGSASALGYLGLPQNELTDVGSDKLQNNALGIVERTSSAGTYKFRRDPSGQILGYKRRRPRPTTQPGVAPAGPDGSDEPVRGALYLSAE